MTSGSALEAVAAEDLKGHIQQIDLRSGRVLHKLDLSERIRPQQKTAVGNMAWYTEASLSHNRRYYVAQNSKRKTITFLI